LVVRRQAADQRGLLRELAVAMARERVFVGCAVSRLADAPERGAARFTDG
jgi:hypothetical protein